MDNIERKLGEISQWQKDHERHDDKRFEEGSKKMAMLATKDDISSLHALLIDDKGQPKFAGREDVARLNNIVHNFTLGVEILSTSSKWVYRIIVGLAILFGAIGLLTGGFKAAAAGFMYMIFGK